MKNAQTTITTQKRLWSKRPMRQARSLIRPLIAWRHWNANFAKQLHRRLVIYKMTFRLCLLIWVLITTQLTLKMRLKMPRVKKVSEVMTETDQDLISPEMTEPTRTKRGRPKGTSTSGASKSSSKLDREVKAIENSFSELFSFFSILSVPAAVVSQALADDVTIACDRSLTFLVPALGDLARDNPRFRAAMLTIGSNQVYFNLIVAAAAIITPILINHNLVSEKADKPFQAMAALKNLKFENENSVPSADELIAQLVSSGFVGGNNGANSDN